MQLRNSDSPYVRISMVLISIVLSLLLLYLGKDLFVPLLLAFFIAVFLSPLCKWLEKLKLGRTLSAVISLLLFVFIITAIIILIGKQFGQFFKVMPALEQKLNDITQNIENYLEYRLDINTATQLSYIKESINMLLSSAGNTFEGFIGLAITIVLFLFFTFYILSFRSLLIKFILSFFGEENKKKVSETTDLLRSMINNYIKGLMIEMMIVFLLAYILLLIFGIKYALLMAVFAAILNIIPYIGIYTATFINILIALATGTNTQGLEVGCIFLAIHLVDSNIILPRIVGSRVKINPLITLIAVVVGELLWGIPGMFLFIPLCAIFRIISDKVPALKSWAILIGEEEKPKIKRIAAKHNAD